MPTIDQLAPATAASDADELMVNQNGISRRITRAQLISGLQSQLAVPTGTLLGRSSPGPGGPESVMVGANLILSNGVLAASPPMSLVQIPTASLRQMPPGSVAYASDGRKPGEALGKGTGVPIFVDSSGRWISMLDGAPVLP